MRSSYNHLNHGLIHPIRHIIVPHGTGLLEYIISTWLQHLTSDLTELTYALDAVLYAFFLQKFATAMYCNCATHNNLLSCKVFALIAVILIIAFVMRLHSSHESETEIINEEFDSKAELKLGVKIMTA